MKILLSPIAVFDNEYIKYSFEGEKITATYKGETDVFDFTGMPNGIASAITTTLAINPIVSAKRINNITSIEIANTIGENASYDERFPEWVDSEALNKPVEEFYPAVELQPSEPSKGSQEPQEELETPLPDEPSIENGGEPIE